MKKLFPALLLPAALMITGCGPSAPKPAATADGAVMQVVEGLNRNRADAPWHMLPAGYQSELNSIKTELAGKLDPDLYDAAAGVVEKLETVLADKKELILASPMLQGVPMRAELNANYDQLVAMLGVLTDSDYSSQAGLKSTDIGSFLSSTGSKLMEIASQVDVSGDGPKPMGMNAMLSVPESIQNTKAELVSEEGDSAVVKITSGDNPPQEVPFVRVEGKWIPQDMAEGFPEMIAEMRGEIENFQITPEQKSKLITGIGMANNVLDQISAAETQEQLQGAMMGIMGMMGAMQ